MISPTRRPTLHTTALWIGLAAVVAGCSTKMPEYAAPVKPPPPPAPPQVAPPPVVVAPPTAPPKAKPTLVSQARKAADYRRDAAQHLYERHATRIFSGKMPPQLYAVGVLDVDVDKVGAITSLRWVRAPSHAPEVIAEIEKAIHAAVPFPAPVRMGRVTYSETWLWDKSGRFQLDTLTEGQH